MRKDQLRQGNFNLSEPLGSSNTVLLSILEGARIAGQFPYVEVQISILAPFGPRMFCSITN